MSNLDQKPIDVYFSKDGRNFNNYRVNFRKDSVLFLPRTGDIIVSNNERLVVTEVEWSFDSNLAINVMVKTTEAKSQPC